MNTYGSLGEPFFFLISYDKTQTFVQPLKELDSDICYEIHSHAQSKTEEKIPLEKKPLCFESYEKKFNILQEHIKSGNSYLLNLTAPTKIKTPLSLQEIYEKSHARFKLKFKEEFVCFSPEKFIEIKKNKILTYPMKGTIDAKIPNAKARILGDIKEMAEHTMVVDLLRNDLGMVGTKVRVDKFRYMDKINAGTKKLLQVSSKISAHLNPNWRNNIGTILDTLLPAGSITGTPKKSTVKILKEVENYDRGFYTGIGGVFDGQCLQSFVLIRFIQNENNEFFYKSGGGITCDSDALAEYQELLDKVYIPT
jgi:para-aminobenzoate synthetase component 1